MQITVEPGDHATLGTV